MLALEGIGKKSMYLRRSAENVQSEGANGSAMEAGMGCTGGKGCSSENTFQGVPVSPVNALVIVRAVEELNLFKGAGAREAASHSWVQAQEEVNSCGS